MSSAAPCATACSAAPSTTATGSSSAPRPQELLAAGYTPVGRDFPVFLHPTTREQYALARTERKAGPGYHGFVFHAAPDVTLEQDLARRDLTINAIAEDPDSGELIDPFGGQRDIQRPRAAPRVGGVCRRPGAAAAAGALRGALARLQRGAGDAGPAAASWWMPARSTRWCPSASGRSWRAASPSGRPAAWSRCCAAAVRWRGSRRNSNAGCATTGNAPRCCCRRSMAPTPMLPLRFACLCHGLDGVDGGVAPGQPALRALCERWRVDTECRDLALLVAREWPALRAGRVGERRSVPGAAGARRRLAAPRAHRCGDRAIEVLATTLPAVERAACAATGRAAAHRAAGGAGGEHRHAGAGHAQRRAGRGARPRAAPGPLAGDRRGVRSVLTARCAEAPVADAVQRRPCS